MVERSAFMRNVTQTAIVFGITLSAMNGNSTMVVNPLPNDSVSKKPAYHTEFVNSGVAYAASLEMGNLYAKKETSLDREARALFGNMREATAEEIEGEKSYIRSIAKETGVNFFDLC